MKITIRREAIKPATCGTMQVDGEPFGFTLELPWLDNKPRISCIPAGTYTVKISRSFRFGKDMLEVMGVPGRAGIRVHNANFAHELQGCIAVARKRYNDEHIGSGLAQNLMFLVAAKSPEPVTLEILDPKGAV